MTHERLSRRITRATPHRSPPQQAALFPLVQTDEAPMNDGGRIPEGARTIPQPVSPEAAPTGGVRSRSASPATPSPPSPPVAAVTTASPPPVIPSGRPYLTADLRAATGLSRTAMDFYLRAGVVRPTGRTESGYLLFDEAELAILREVLIWRARGIALKEIKARLGRGDASVYR